MATARGGACLSRTYLGIHRLHLFRCGAGHEWEAQPANLRHRGSWCPVCADRPKPMTPAQAAQRLAEIQAIARARMGRCLSRIYRGDKNHLLFECADGHQWWATPNTIKRPHWCPRCRHGQPREEVVTGMAREVPRAPILARRNKEIQRVFKAVVDTNRDADGGVEN
ncbi:hypothetical protein LMG32289_05415 [Cupriavidus pampae]|uniref:Zinc-ribbon domain-containing protein n=2 Tax=Cupriavidus pampae TaxID=659251 RepID=A0ABM8XTT3_9BURK|nr:hypothetical protein LMG32289_05415 [Cupriavidus pampae]